MSRTAENLVTSPEDLPLVCEKRDLARLLNKSERSVDRYYGAKLLPEPLIPDTRPRWSRDQVVSWLAGGSRRGRK